MRQGTIAVREALREGLDHITDKQIQEALWHYYYDVDKSVAYLATTYKSKKTIKKVTAKKGGFNCSLGLMRELSGRMCGRQAIFGGVF